MISVSEIESREQLSQIKQRWDSLLSECEDQAPYLTFEWYRTALETFDSDKTPLLLFFSTSGRDVALIPLVHKTLKISGFTFHQISFVYNPYTPYQRVIHRDGIQDILSNLINHLRNKFGSLFYLDLDEIRITSQEENAVNDLAAEGTFFFLKEIKTGSRYLILKEDFEQTLGALKSKTQKEFRRKIKRMSKLGEIDLIKIRGDNQIDEHLDRYFTFRAHTWKGEEPNPEFYYKLCKEFDKVGKLYFYALTIEGKPIAYLIGLLGTDTIYGVKTTYDPSYYAFSPGVILFYKSIEHMFSISGLREFDIGRGDEQFKREWTSLTHEHTRLTIYPNTSFWHIVNNTRYNVLPLMKKNWIFNKVYSAIRSRVTGEAQPPAGNITEVTKKVQKQITWDDYKKLADSIQYSVRFAQAEDLERMTVAMAAPNFREVQERMNKMHCVLVLDDSSILAYFWMPPKPHPTGREEKETPKITINEWGMDESRADERTRDECIAIMLKLLIDKGITEKGVILVT